MISSIVSNGMQAMLGKLDAHAQNIANARTPGYRKLVPRTTENPEGGVDLSVERDPGELEAAYGPDGTPVETPEADPSTGRVSSTTGSLDQEGNDVDLVEEMVGMDEAVLTMQALAKVYQRSEAALGSLFDAFG